MDEQDNIILTVGINIRKWRKKRNMSQEELAKEMNIDRTMVSKWERGKTLIGIDKISSIARILEVNVEMLFENEK